MGLDESHGKENEEQKGKTGKQGIRKHSGGNLERKEKKLQYQISRPETEMRKKIKVTSGFTHLQGDPREHTWFRLQSKDKKR